MDRDPWGWTVMRHVVDVAFRELDQPRPTLPDTYLAVGQTGTEDTREGRLEIAASIDV